MRIKMWKAVSAAAAAGTLLQLGGCLSNDLIQQAVISALSSQFPGLLGLLPAGV